MSEQASQPAVTWHVWLDAARPKTLWAGISPVIIGAALAYADHGFHWPTVVLCLLTGMSVQIGANYSNDYFDFVNGTDTKERIGPTRATAAGLVSPVAMKRAFIIAYGITMVCSAVLAWRVGWWVIVLGAICVACGILYTGGPWPLGYNGLGDLFAFVFFGPVAVVCTHYFQTLHYSHTSLIAGIAPGMFSVALITVNNLRDVEQDAKGGKRTLAVLLGPRFARLEYTVALLIALLIPMALYLWAGCGPWAILPLVVVAFMASRALPVVYNHSDGPSLNRCLALTGKMELVHSLLFAIALVIG